MNKDRKEAKPKERGKAWQGRKRCRFYEWWEREKWEVLAKRGEWYGRM